MENPSFNKTFKALERIKHFDDKAFEKYLNMGPAFTQPGGNTKVE